MRRDIAQGSLIINVWMQPEPDTRAGELKHYSLLLSLPTDLPVAAAFPLF